MQECDLVITKPGYGTLAECWQTKTPLVYVPRETFPEYPYLDAWLQRHAPASRLPSVDFVRGHWLPAMREVLNCPRAYPDISASGALQAAQLISDGIT